MMVRRRPKEMAIVKMRGLKPKIKELFELKESRAPGEPDFIDNTSFTYFKQMADHRKKVFQEMETGHKNNKEKRITDLVDQMAKRNVRRNIEKIRDELKTLSNVAKESVSEIENADNEINVPVGREKEWESIIKKMKAPGMHVQNKFKEHNLLVELNNILQSIPSN